MAKDVTEMSREELEETVIEQSRQLRTLETQRNHWHKSHDNVQEEYLKLSHVVMKARELTLELSKAVN